MAKLAGVSRTTVSRVLNKDKNVKETTRTKIEKIILESGYEKNYIGSTLASKNNKKIYVFILKSSVNSYSTELKKGLYKFRDENEKFGYEIEIIQTSINKPNDQIDKLDWVLMNCSPSGIIITPLLKKEILKRVLENKQISFLSLDNMLSKDISHIGAKYYNSGEISGNITSGILRNDEKVLVLKFPGDKVSVEEYYKGFISSIQKNNLIIVELEKQILLKNNFLKNYLTEDIKSIFSNRYILEVIEANIEFFTKQKEIKMIGIAGNPKINRYLKNNILYATINEQFFEIGYNAGKLMFEAIYKNNKKVEHNYIKPIVIFKSMI
ncbi:MAG: LacI family DNA-binding transcriptional regulator [Fusobacteriaceae bacterium]